MIVYHTQIDSATDTEYKNKWADAQEAGRADVGFTMWILSLKTPKTRGKSDLLLAISGNDVFIKFAFFCVRWQCWQNCLSCLFACTRISCLQKCLYDRHALSQNFFSCCSLLAVDRPLAMFAFLKRGFLRT